MENQQRDNTTLMGGAVPRHVVINPFVVPLSIVTTAVVQLRMEPLNYGKQGRYGDSLNTGDIVAILDTRSSGRGTEGAGISLEASSDMNMTSFDVNSFQITESTGGSMKNTGEFHQSVSAMVTDSMSSATAVEPMKAHFMMDPKAAPATGALAVSTTSALVDAAYTQFSKPSNPIAKNRKVKCKFLDCPNLAQVSQYYGDFCNRHVIVAPCGFPGCRDKAMERAAMSILSVQSIPRASLVPNSRKPSHVQAQELADRPGATESYENILPKMQQDIRRCTHENCMKNSQRDRLCTTHFYEKHNQQKKGSTPDTSAALASKEENESSQQENVRESDARAIERPRGSKQGCKNLSHAAGLCAKHINTTQNLIPSQRRCDPISSDSAAATLMADDDNGKTQALSTGRDQPQIISPWTGVASINCTNPICDRNGYGGQDY
ncbi:unnamed protein product [Peronospora destructor]|uniref:Uncharacterized protein n=1 Tax=Peronospora destructor TaxID=86335 RepID=A0AAV0UBI7_9STRA|nr:unnamed protein product [Peronospora destructor]